MTTPRDIEAARERLHAAGRALRTRPRRRTVESLGRLLDAWSAPEGPWQRRLVEALPEAAGFSPENVRDGLAAGLREWDAPALEALVAAELPGSESGEKGAVVTGFPSTSVLLAGSIPMPTLLSLVAPLVVHSPVLAKTASRDPVTAGLVRESLCEVDPDLGAALEVVSFDGGDGACTAAFADAPCVVATGSDETVAAMRRLVPPSSRFVGYGHRVSVAVIDAEATSPQQARAVARDVCLWDQLGCLSPIAVYLVGPSAVEGSASVVDDFAQDLAAALGALAESLPRGEIPAEVAAAFRSERDAAEMRRAGGAEVRVHADPSLRFAVVREADARLRPAPLHRFVRVHPVADREALGVALAPLAPHLAGVALDGFGPERDEVTRDLAALGASRVCAPGQLQTPPLAWRHDNLPVLLPLARLCDLEGAG